MAKAPSTYIGPYRLLNVVHTGHTCQIWQAYDDANSCIVGVKTLLENFQRDREHIGYLKWEYAVGMTLDHPLLIRLTSYGVDRKMPYLAMEWFTSPNLKQRMNLGFEKMAFLLPTVIEKMAVALGYFHSKGWVHRDIKPDNYLVTDEGDVRLIDFALARKHRSGLGKFFAMRTKVQGTRSYMSPEQIRGGTPDIRSDIYSFGCMVHELFSGRPPFTGVNSNDLLNKHLRALPPPLESANQNVTPEFAQLVRKTMAKNPSGRPHTMEDFITELRMIRIFKIYPKRPEAERV